MPKSIPKLSGVLIALIESTKNLLIIVSSGSINAKISVNSAPKRQPKKVMKNITIKDLDFVDII
tara:strand:+ start:315 stop:506 length:192 start_codon:yes stop_codon:yes gene_type:complete